MRGRRSQYRLRNEVDQVHKIHQDGGPGARRCGACTHLACSATRTLATPAATPGPVGLVRLCLTCKAERPEPIQTGQEVSRGGLANQANALCYLELSLRRCAKLCCTRSSSCGGCGCGPLRRVARGQQLYGGRGWGAQGRERLSLYKGCTRNVLSSAPILAGGRRCGCWRGSANA